MDDIIDRIEDIVSELRDAYSYEDWDVVKESTDKLEDLYSELDKESYNFIDID